MHINSLVSRTTPFITFSPVRSFQLAHLLTIIFRPSFVCDLRILHFTRDNVFFRRNLFFPPLVSDKAS
jgi:hypothetical protein